MLILVGRWGEKPRHLMTPFFYPRGLQMDKNEAQRIEEKQRVEQITYPSDSVFITNATLSSLGAKRAETEPLKLRLLFC